MLPIPSVSIFVAVAAVQISSVCAAAGLRLREKALRDHMSSLVSLAVGVLLATALLHLLPEAVDQLGNRRAVWGSVGLTMLLLFALDRTFAAIPAGTAEPELPRSAQAPAQAGAPLTHGRPNLRPASLLSASMLHSFIDGATIAAAFVAGARIGWLTAFAVALHEIPHRAGDFAVFVHLGVSPARALRLATWTGFPAFLGWAAVLLLGRANAQAIPWLLPVSAGAFLYLATVSLMPELELPAQRKDAALQVLSLAVGIALVAAVAGVPER